MLNGHFATTVITMCPVCNGTHVVHEITTIGYRTSCCPECGPQSDGEWKASMVAMLADIEKRQEGIRNVRCE